MKRASYRNGIDLIAMNDEPAIMDPDEMIGYASVMLLAELFGVTQQRVADDVVRYRRKIEKQERRRTKVIDGRYVASIATGAD